MLPKDKQLRDIRLKDVLEKRRLEQALNTKEFAVVAGISYSTAREWFRLPGFPTFRGVVFWPDFTQWRMQQNGLQRLKSERPAAPKIVTDNCLPPRAQKILSSA